ncbi:hypothetical protein BHM03_00002656 [Ensete ventricosum]|nr:hypothetical protein BHM03_00002656 [Ensete ventricosum]
MTAMLSAPNEKNRPLFAAKDILSFYMDHSPKIFPQPRYHNPNTLTTSVLLEDLISSDRMQAKDDELMDAQLSDVCISTSAAPTYLPAHHFKTKNHKGEVLEFNLIDGGIAANNPVWY